jgi:hypothetical protein
VAIVTSVLLTLGVSISIAPAAGAAGTGTTCFGTTWQGTDNQYSLLRVKNCATKPVWIGIDNGLTSMNFLAHCIAPGAAYTVDRSMKAGPMASGKGIPQYCTTPGTQIGVAGHQVAWGSKQLGFN